ncbi:UDP-N-acetylmuramate--L-alanine ligase [Parachitinimonas caeni]|uniref:UDP-N-acetylmuramate--L-alanine ligase n=1 Tax=Parachitinimonas caeni TaxID=3031301 RepID=A0ABT7DQW7_9NEIS|nr:UDP-N-acetylmuramate--L-alanine ligase [Parachitinimonas caeni]MDK2122464.1 UDP-N-acetylmuramate--L-alanine ligase [Parachitinimonas caeni]
MKHKVKRIHFVGIGGAGMSAIAGVLLDLGFEISGSDLGESSVTHSLQTAGARIHIGHDAAHIAGVDVVVTSTAVRADNPEVLAARSRGVPVIPRAMMLAELLRFRQGIAVAGTHGKTTTTSLIASVLSEAGLDPTYVIGGKLNTAGTGAKLGRGDFIVVEADESDASFLLLQPVLAVITNIDADHMDTYGHDFVRLKQAFLDFISHLPFYGRAILCIDDPNVRAILPMVSKPVTTYGTSADAMLRAENIEAMPGGKMRFTAIWKNGEESRMEILLNAAGHHNVLNALATIAVALEVGAEETAIQAALAGFGGVGRRFQHHGEATLPQGGKALVIDDYGHHPVEMAATLAAVRGAYPDRRLLLAFQPHRYTRTRDCFEDFSKVLSTVDALVLTEVYSAGEAPIVAADGRALTRAVRVHAKVEPLFVEALGELPTAILEHAKDGDVIVTMGAGSIGGIPARLVGKQ